MGMAGSRLGTAARLSLVALVASFALGPLPADAAFPGANGKIAFSRGMFASFDIYSINPDGTGQTQLTSAPYDTTPAWSPDGTKIAFASNRDHLQEFSLDIYVMNADGSGVTRLTTNERAFDPAWSPDGTRIAFVHSTNALTDTHPYNYDDIYLMNSDGSGITNLTPDSECLWDGSPAWSPDGRKIAFDRGQVLDCTTEEPTFGGSNLYVMNADGSGQMSLTTSGGSGPDWSPDGAKIAFGVANEIDVMDPDGSNQRKLIGNGFAPAWSPDGTMIAFVRGVVDIGGRHDDLWRAKSNGGTPTQLTTNPEDDNDPTWQPLPGSSPAPSYEAPKLASPVKVSLVPLHRQCATAQNPSNATHGPPLAHASCSPPQPSSGLARIGPQAIATAQLAVIYGDTSSGNGDQADVTIRASLTDVQTPLGLDYDPDPTGPDLTLVQRLRITDRYSGPSLGDPATTVDFDFSVAVDCALTVDPGIGSSCNVDTSADAVMPGAIKENKAAVVQVFRVRVNDPGANGIRGDSDDRIFMMQGVFIP
jgi:Tol biopolymer transport system component